MKSFFLKNLFWVTVSLLTVSLGYSQIPVITNFSPTSASAGDLIQITGNDLSLVTGASIGTTQAFIVHQENNLLVLMVNEGSTTGLINLDYMGGTVSSTGDLNIEPFNFYEAPSQVFHKTDGANSAGKSVAISADGTTMATGGPTSGNIRIFTRNNETSSFVQDTTVTKPGQAGWSIALSALGNVLVFGAPASNGNVGVIWIYEKINGTWVEYGQLVGSGAVAGFGYGFGCAVAISADGTTIASSSPSGGQGGAWIFRKINGIWSQVGNRLTGSGVIGGNPSGQGAYTISLTADGNTLAVAGNDNASRGAVWIFKDLGMGWSQVQKVVPPDNYSDGIGGSTTVLTSDGNYLIAGAHTSRNPLRPPGAQNGATLIYAWNGATYYFYQKLQSTESFDFNHSGRTLSANANGTVLAVGECDEFGLSSGGVRLYFKAGEYWEEQPGKIRYTPTVDADTLEFVPNDGQGKSVALSVDGKWMVMGSPDANFGSYIFNASPSPTVSDFTPEIGGVNDIVTITGSNLQTAQEVRINNVGATITQVSSSQVRARLNGGVNGVGDVWLRTKGGLDSLSGFTYVEVPVITSFNPTSGGPGTVITVNGQNLLHIQNSVMVGDSVAANVDVINDNQLLVTISNCNTGPISLETIGGQTVSAQDFQFIIPAPVITNFFPTSASANEIVTINGNNFLWVTAVSFGGVPAQGFSINELGQIEASVGYGASGDVTIESGGGQNSLSGFQFTLPPPIVHAYSPTSAPIGSLITIYGENLLPTTEISINNTNAVVVSKSDYLTRAFVMPNSTTGQLQVNIEDDFVVATPDLTITNALLPDTQQGGLITGTSNIPFDYGNAASISADGRTVAIGAYNDQSEIGSVRMYTRGADNSYTEVQLIQPSQVQEHHGTSVSLSADGNTLAIGSPGYPSNAPGTIYIYKRSEEAANWMYDHTIDHPAGAMQFGDRITISADGKRLAVGGRSDAVSPTPSYVYDDLPGQGWTLSQTFFPNGQIVGFGRWSNVALSSDGNTLVIGIYGDNLRRGAIWIYRYNQITGQWPATTTKIIPTDLPAGEQRFGENIAISADGNRVIAGSTPDFSAGLGQGKFWSFSYNGVNWIQEGLNVKPSDAGAGNTAFARSITLSADGTLVAVGAPGLGGGFWFFFTAK